MQAFCRVLRDAEVSVGLSSEIDALKAVMAVGIASRSRLKTALALTLIKNQDDIARFEETFDLFWGSEIETVADDMPSALDSLSPTARSYAAAAVTGTKALLKKVAVDIAARHVASAGLPEAVDIPKRVEKSMLDYPGREQALQSLAKSHAGTREARLINRNLASLERAVEHSLNEMVVEKNGHSVLQQITKNHAVKERAFIDMDARCRWEAGLAVARLVRLLSFAPSRHYQPGSHVPRPDFRKVYRQIVRTGLPVPLRYSRQKKSKPDLVVLLDMSGSVKYISEFWLLILNAIKSAWGDVTAVGFTNVVSLLSLKGGKAQNAPPLKAYSDYGNVFAEVETRFASRFDPGHTSLLVFGDARNNKNAANVAAFRRIAGRCRRVLWLNPEPRDKWNTGDSVQYAYSPFCHLTLECSTLAHLESFAQTVARGVL